MKYLKIDRGGSLSCVHLCTTVINRIKPHIDPDSLCRFFRY